MKITVFKGGDGQWYFRIRAQNGRVLAHSEGYRRKRSALRTAQSIAWASRVGWRIEG